MIAAIVLSIALAAIWGAYGPKTLLKVIGWGALGIAALLAIGGAYAYFATRPAAQATIPEKCMKDRKAFFDCDSK